MIESSEPIAPSQEELIQEIPGMKKVSSSGNHVVINGIIDEWYINSPLELSGIVPESWIIDGIFPISIIDTSNIILSQGVGTIDWDSTIDIDWLVPFTSTLTFSRPEWSLWGRVRFQKNLSGENKEAEIVDVSILWGTPGKEETTQGQSHVDIWINNFESCVAGGWELENNMCLSFDGRVFTDGTQVDQTETQTEESEQKEETVNTEDDDVKSKEQAQTITSNSEKLGTISNAITVSYLCDQWNGIKFSLTSSESSKVANYQDSDTTVQLTKKVNWTNISYTSRDGTINVITQWGEVMIQKWQISQVCMVQ